MVVDRRHAYESHEKKMSKKKLKWMINETLAIQGKSKKKIDFHFFGGK
jgi:sulfatase maturation enzyme AslB (radical SAM superfamily)